MVRKPTNNLKLEKGCTGNRGTVNFKPHSIKQQDAIYSEMPITAVVTGIQWGKTECGAWWTKRRIHKYNDLTDNFIITAPTYKVMEQSTLPAFMRIMKDCGEYNKADAVFTVKGGGKVFMRTAKDPDSIVGMTNVRGIWCDEAGKYPLYFWDNIEGRAAFKKAPIILTTSPYSLNWIHTKVMKPARDGKRDDVLIVHAASNENPYFPEDIFHKRREQMDPRRFNAMYGGNFEKMQGLVFDCFDDDENICETVDLAGARYFGGIDWGYTDPFVFKVRAITPNGMHYSISEYYKTGRTLTDIVELLSRKITTFPIEMIYCDPSEPGYIEELNRNNIPCTAANNDIRRGIDVHYGLIKSRRYKVLAGTCKHTMDEYSTYHWPEPKDLGPDENAKPEKPVDQNNHTMDTERYLSLMTHRIFEKRRPVIQEIGKKPHQELPVDFVKRIKKRKSLQHTENWS